MRVGCFDGLGEHGPGLAIAAGPFKAVADISQPLPVVRCDGSGNLCVDAAVDRLLHVQPRNPSTLCEALLLLGAVFTTRRKLNRS